MAEILAKVIVWLIDWLS